MPDMPAQVNGRTTLQNIGIYFILFILINGIGLGAYVYLQGKHVDAVAELKVKVDQKYKLLHDINVQLGFGHLIHNFKNYVIRGESDYRTSKYSEKFQADIAQVEQSIQAYRQIPDLHSDEIEGLNAVESIINQYRNMSQKVAQLRQNGLSVSEIDSKVVVDDRPAMQAIPKWYAYISQSSTDQLEALSANNAFIERVALFFVFTLSIILSLLAFEFFIRRAVLKPIVHIQEELNDICTNREDIFWNVEIALEGTRELKKLEYLLQRMLCRIHDQVEQLNSVKTVVDQSSANFMLADNDLNITYMNEAIVETLKKVEKDIQKMLPHFSTDNLVGQNIDIFHVHPEHQRKLLASLKDTYTADLKLGELHLQIIVNPVWGQNGERNGFVTEWKDITESVKLEKMQMAVEQNLKVMVERAARGYIGEQIDVSVLDGFVHDLGEQINFMTSAIHQANTNISNVIQLLAQGDLTKRVEGDYEDGLGEMKDAINGSLDNLSSILAQVNYAVRQISDDINQTTERNTDLSSRIQQQAASIEETAATMEQITAAVRNNAENAQQANDLTVQASHKTLEGADVMKQTIQAMQNIKESSDQIEQIIGLIDSIAFQTNLLALNAAVEAARAGEHGRGFAVVAGEVRSLAGKSADAAREIKGLIERSTSQVQDGTKLAEQSGSALTEISQAITQVTDIVGEIATSSVEQSQGIEQLNQAIVLLDKNTQENAHLVELSASSAQAIASQSEQLVARMQQFRILNQFEAEAKKAQVAAVNSVRQTAQLSAPKPTVKTDAEQSSRSEMKPKTEANKPQTKPVAVVKPSSTDNDDEWADF